MTRKEAIEEFDSHVDIASDTVQKQLAWLEWVPEDELTLADLKALFSAFKASLKVAGA